MGERQGQEPAVALEGHSVIVGERVWTQGALQNPLPPYPLLRVSLSPSHLQ